METAVLDVANDLLGVFEELGPSTEADVLEGVLPLAGLSLVDVSCGGGRVARQLVARGARVLGVEPDPLQAEKNRAAPPVEGLSFAEAPGEALPLADGSVDGVVFSFSLHHVPEGKMAAALDEACRVLRPGGLLCVFEPLLSGSLEAVQRPFHDESAVRRQAYEALRRHVLPRCAEARQLVWSEEVAYDDFEAFLADYVSATHVAFHRARIDTPEVRARFEAGRRGDRFVFTSYGRADICRGLGPA